MRLAESYEDSPTKNYASDNGARSYELMRGKGCGNATPGGGSSELLTTRGTFTLLQINCQGFFANSFSLLFFFSNMSFNSGPCPVVLSHFLPRAALIFSMTLLTCPALGAAGTSFRYCSKARSAGSSFCSVR